MRSWMVCCALPLALIAGASYGQVGSPDSVSNPWFVPRPLDPPSPPSLVAFKTPSGNCGLSWGGGTEAEGYRVYRSTDGKTFARIAELKRDTPTFTDRDTDARGIVYYRVRAYNAAGETDSNTALLTGARTATAVRMRPMRVSPKPVDRKGGASRKHTKR